MSNTSAYAFKHFAYVSLRKLPGLVLLIAEGRRRVDDPVCAVGVLIGRLREHPEDGDLLRRAIWLLVRVCPDGVAPCVAAEIGGVEAALAAPAPAAPALAAPAPAARA